MNASITRKSTNAQVFDMSYLPLRLDCREREGERERSRDKE